ncbi:predicted protein [Coccidioides posadasii str. Silveira]|uniref:Predicted protein n=1 Tax=Coccidioides posadasii (strain RMSCC 757 / Silveira) TaxID=443226 RepID=E9DH39_COCPS|nr:predicted protein [Coccidioides posadasii str. Silveira]
MLTKAVTGAGHTNSDEGHDPLVWKQKQKSSPQQQAKHLHHCQSFSAASLLSESLFALDNNSNHEADISSTANIDTTLRQCWLPPLPLLVFRNGVKRKEWQVNKILDLEIVHAGGRVQLGYLVDWKGYDEPSWEPSCNLIPGSELLVLFTTVCSWFIAKYSLSFLIQCSPCTVRLGLGGSMGKHPV